MRQSTWFDRLLEIKLEQNPMRRIPSVADLERAARESPEQFRRMMGLPKVKKPLFPFRIVRIKR